MGEREWPVRPGLTNLLTPPAIGQPKPKVPGFFQAAENAFLQENDVVNIIEFLRRPSFEDDPNYDPLEHVPESRFFEDHRGVLARAGSLEELRFLEERIELGEQRRAEQAASGLTGTLFGVASGVLSPTSFIPLTGAVRGARGLTIVGRNAVAAAALNEGALALNQPLRQTGEIIEGFSTQVVLGALLGGAAQYFRGSADQVVADIYDVPPLPSGDRSDFVDTVETPQVTITNPGGSLSAAENLTLDPGKLKGAGGVTIGGKRYSVENLVSRIGAGARVIQHGATDAARRAAQTLDDVGLKMERNEDFVPTALGGTVRNRTTAWNGPLAKGIQALDETFYKYRLGENAAGLRGIRSAIPQQGKLNREQFNAEISRAMNYGDESVIPEAAEAAKIFRSQIIEPMAKAAQEAGLLPSDLKTPGSVSYLMRLYSSQKIARDPQGFVNTLTRHFQHKLEQRVQKASARATEEADDARQIASDLEASPEDAQNFVKQLEDELADLDQYHPAADLDKDLREFSNERRRLTKAGEDTSDIDATKAAFLAGKTEEDMAMLREFRKLKARKRRRLSTIAKSKFALENEQIDLLTRASRAEDLNIGALERLVNKAQQILKRLDKLSDEALNAELDKLITQIEGVLARIDKNDFKLEKMLEEAESAKAAGKDTSLAEEAIDSLFQAQGKRGERYRKVAARLRAAQSLDREAAREALELTRKEAIQSASDIVSRRAVRRQKLIDRAKAIDPESATKAAQAARETADKAFTTARNRLTEGDRGILPSDLEVRGDGVFLAKSETALKLAESFRNYTMGTPIRTPGMDLLQAERGPALARMLDIDYASLEPYLETDVETILKAYVRTMAPDIELKRAFNDPGLQSIIGQGGAIDQELNQKLRALQAQTLSPENMQKQSEKLQARAEQDKLDLATMVQRIRHTRGIPADPTHMFYRIGRTVKDVNVATLMGSVVTSSVADIARPVMKFGLLNTMRHGWLPWVSSMKTRRMTQREAASAGGAVDLILHNRFQAMLDVMDDHGRRNLFERGAQTLAQKTGVVALFDHWNTAHKQMVSMIANNELWSSIETVSKAPAPEYKMVKGKRVKQKPSRKVARAQEFLASHGIDDSLARRFAEEAAAGKGEFQNGTFWPNTAEWDDDTQIAFRAFLNKAMEDTIITPGPGDRPRWVDQNIGLSMLAQFRSFMFSSTFKTVLAGMQDRDAAAFSGAMLSLGLGGLSYYLWAVSVGGKAYERMLEATPEEWAEEAILRSGLLGALSEPMMLTDAASRDYRPEVRLATQALGPSAGLALSVSNLVSDAVRLDADKQTIRDARRLTPYQNVFWFRQVFNEAQKALEDQLP